MSGQSKAVEGLMNLWMIDLMAVSVLKTNANK